MILSPRPVVDRGDSAIMALSGRTDAVGPILHIQPNQKTMGLDPFAHPLVASVALGPGNGAPRAGRRERLGGANKPKLEVQRPRAGGRPERHTLPSWARTPTTDRGPPRRVGGPARRTGAVGAGTWRLSTNTNWAPAATARRLRPQPPRPASAASVSFSLALETLRPAAVP